MCLRGILRLEAPLGLGALMRRPCVIPNEMRGSTSVFEPQLIGPLSLLKIIRILQKTQHGSRLSAVEVIIRFKLLSRYLILDITKHMHQTIIRDNYDVIIRVSRATVFLQPTFNHYITFTRVIKYVLRLYGDPYFSGDRFVFVIFVFFYTYPWYYQYYY